MTFFQWFARGLPALVVAPVFLAAEPAPPATPTSAVTVDVGDPVLTDWTAPEYPEAALRQKLSGRVDVEFVVDAAGAVTDLSVRRTTDPIFNAAALAAIPKWKFNAGIDDGKPIAVGVTVPVVFDFHSAGKKLTLADLPDELHPVPLPVSKPEVKEAPDPDYPDELSDRKLPGEVVIDFTVSPEGNVVMPKVVWASHAAFVVMSLRALENTHFKPAHQGPLPKPGKMRYPVEFEMSGGTPPAIIEANHLSVAPSETAGEVPLPLMLAEPVYPYERLLAAEAGNAVAEFNVDEKGRTSKVTIVSASAPEFGLAFQAAVESWIFRPINRLTGIIPSRLRCSYDFVPPTDGPAARIVNALRPGGAGVSGAQGLDRPLAPLWRGFPVYPMDLREEGTKGSATIDFVIDRDGRARGLRITNATNDAFGWAAAAAISQWVFEPPLRKGEPVDVRVSIPVAFAPPKT
ncbi:MAG TPA: TonB family protein [Candidatus Didemnitutus sp.]|nr:TonB family protein [Candidatus Didemnitutus sp.]